MIGTALVVVTTNSRRILIVESVALPKKGRNSSPGRRVTGAALAAATISLRRILRVASVVLQSHGSPVAKALAKAWVGSTPMAQGWCAAAPTVEVCMVAAEVALQAVSQVVLGLEVAFEEVVFEVAVAALVQE